MAESFLNGKVTLCRGDCLEVLPLLEADSIDSCVTDPPYGLLFMGRGWDSPDNIAFRPEVWAEVLRVLKPGAHLLAFGGTRTYHRMACAIEDAGFEIRDQIGWCYGSGFPKSHDIAKSIDKRRDDRNDIEHVRLWLEARRKEAGFTRKTINAALGLADNGGGLASTWTTNNTISGIPQWEQWLRLKSLLKFSGEMDSEVWRLNGRKGTPGDDWFRREVVGETTHSRSGGNDFAKRPGSKAKSRSEAITSPATESAIQWQGWGTALKPAWEPIVLARKPLSESSIAANVLKHGTGAINVDGCRVGTGGDKGEWPLTARTDSRDCMAGPMSAIETNQTQGRWPANLIHDGSEEVLAGFPETQSGQLNTKSKAVGWNGDGGTQEWLGASGDSGSAARFFYTAKADADDRLGSKHPTVKPIDLIQYLCRLITPPAGTCLDPFAGTGTTGEGAWREGFRAILIERESEYQADIVKRMGLCLSGQDGRRAASIKQVSPGDLPLFRKEVI